MTRARRQRRTRIAERTTGPKRPDGPQTGGRSQPAPAAPIRQLVIALIVVAGIVLATHWPALDARAITFDDDEYLLENELVRNPSWHSAGRFFREVLDPSTVRGYYQPLSMISLTLDCALGGGPDNLRPIHRTSLALHVVNAALVIVFVYLLFGGVWVAAGLGLLFGVHPMTIEAIPWIAERKSLLAAFFALWCLVLYVAYVRRKGKGLYVGSLTACVLALLSKPTSTPLPILLLLLDFWPLRRLNRRALVEKVPFFLVAGLSAVVTFMSQSRTYGVTLPGEISPWRVPLVLCHNIIFYLYKLLWPANLSWYYTYPNPFNLSHPMVLAGAVGTPVLIVLLLISLRRTRALLSGWLFFFVAIFPTMGVVSFFGLIAADRFVYLPMVGLLLPLGWLLTRYGRAAAAAWSSGLRSAVLVAIVLVLAGSEAVATRRYLRHWKDSESLARHMVLTAPRANVPRVGLGNCLLERGELTEAMEQFRQALRLNPVNHNAYNGLGAVLAQQGRLDQAVEHYRKALELMPDDPRTHNNLAAGLIGVGRPSEAIEHLREALRLKPGYPKARKNLGYALLKQGKLEEAVAEYRAALRLQPKDLDAHLKLGEVLARLGRTSEAATICAAAVRLKPHDPVAHSTLANVLTLEGKTEEAVRHYTEALRLRPGDAATHYNLGAALARQGRINEAVKQYNLALRKQPDDAEVLYALGATLAALGRIEEAVKAYRQVLRIDPDFPEAREQLDSLVAGRDE